MTEVEEKAVCPEVYKLSPDAEIHTTDLQADCLRTVQLRHQGLERGEYTTALYRGQLAGAACSYLHEYDAWDDAGVSDAIQWADAEVEKMAEEENRPLSGSVRQNKEAIRKEAESRVSHYSYRLADYFAQCKLIGTELPIRGVIEVPGMEPITLASHLDLIFRDPNGQLKVWDFKYQDEAPTMAYLGRNLQFASYFLMTAYGEVRTDAQMDVWTRFGEFADFAWVDLARFKPYTRRTEIADGMTGEVTTYTKGDHRPLKNIVRRWTYSPDKEDEMRREIATRVLMFRHGLFPTSPDKLACHLCECRHACPAFHHDTPEVVPQ